MHFLNVAAAVARDITGDVTADLTGYQRESNFAILGLIQWRSNRHVQSFDRSVRCLRHPV